jgi:hypothetical protein
MTTEKTSRAEPVEVVADLADVVARLKKVIQKKFYWNFLPAVMN